ncbi:MAG TPA: hypothetical protein VFR84_04580 [Candidatus Angelobacter sp.]|nr:hypothetical protein [Candidatus Angelobacter sp.]
MLRPLTELNAEIFRQQLHTKFKVAIEGGESLALELAAVEEPPHAPGMELFSLQFTGPFTPRLVQRTHRLEHEKLGEFEILITPIAAEPGEGTKYESIFHRFRDKKI